MQATPATWYMLLEAGWAEANGFLALCGGEPLPPDLARRLLRIGCKLWNLYGPTETTIWSTLQRVDHTNHPIPVGSPILNTSVLLLNEDGEVVPEGELGELVIGGAGVARGYHNRPELTAERFFTARSRDGLSERFFRTGDFGRRLPDGAIEFVGRADRQIKLQGFRIELGEIEAVLCEHPEVLKCAVIAEGTGLDKRLVAFVVSRPDRQVKKEELLDTLRRNLPPYMFPHKVLLVPHLPLTLNGKVDRMSLASARHEPMVVI